MVCLPNENEQAYITNASLLTDRFYILECHIVLSDEVLTNRKRVYVVFILRIRRTLLKIAEVPETERARRAACVWVDLRL